MTKSHTNAFYLNQLHTGSLVTHTIGSHFFYQIVSSESQLMEPCRTSLNYYVTSGVQQSSVLAHKLFLMYINDINENIQSSIRLFADDSIIYRKMNSNSDHQILQTDLIQLEKWSDKWQMQFNIYQKCARSNYKQN